jgi:HD-like signal output (HDOD) protein
VQQVSAGAGQARADRRKLFELVERMPTFSQSVLRILQLTSTGNAAPKELVRLVEHDPILTVKVLRLVNSAYFGLGREVTSISQGVVYIGANTVKHLAISIAAIGALPRENTAGFDMQAFWTHSLITGSAARLIAQRQGVPRNDATAWFIAGLLHDIGEVVLAHGMPGEYREVLQVARERDIDIVSVEREHLGTDHAEIGSLLGAHWKLPQELVQTIARHHDAAGAAKLPPLAMAVFAANQVAKLSDHPDRAVSRVEPLPEAVAQWLGLTLADLVVALDGLPAELEAARAFVQLPESHP